MITPEPLTDEQLAQVAHVKQAINEAVRNLPIAPMVVIVGLGEYMTSMIAFIAHTQGLSFREGVDAIHHDMLLREKELMSSAQAFVGARH